MTTQFRTQYGVWRVASTERLEPGSTVTVRRRNGQESTVIIGAQIAHDADRELPYLYSFEDQRARTAQPAERVHVVPEASRLFDLFTRAASHSHTVAVRFALSATQRGLRLEMAQPGSRYHGQMLALSEERGRQGRRTMYGALNRSGTFAGRVGVTQIELDIFNEVGNVLRNFAADPAGYAAAHGRETGSCSFCGRGLTDERSLAVGYGPICADHYGLPWGDSAPDFDVASGSRRQIERLADNAGRPNAFDGSDRLEHQVTITPIDVAADEEAANDDMRFGVGATPVGTTVDAMNRQLGEVWVNAQGEIINRTAHGIETAAGGQLDAWGRQFNVRREILVRGNVYSRTDEELRAAILAEQRSIATGQPVNAPTLEDIQNEPNVLRRMAMAAQRASAGLPNVQRDAMGRIIERSDDYTREGGSSTLRLDNGMEYRVAPAATDLRPGDLVTIDEQGRATRAVAGAEPQAVVEAHATMDGRVVTTVRRVRPAAQPAAPAARPAAPRTSPLERLRERQRARGIDPRREGVAAPTDETTTTVVRAVRRDPNTPLEEDDFIWPPRNTENHTAQE